MERVTALPLIRHDLEPDLDRAEQAAATFLQARSIATDAPGLARTPRRMAQAYAELFSPRPFQATTFDDDEGHGELVSARNIPFRSVCERHLLPFTRVAHVGYLPAQILGLSKLARVVEHFAYRPKVQERLTKQIAHWLDEQLHPRGVGVLITAERPRDPARSARHRIFHRDAYPAGATAQRPPLTPGVPLPVRWVALSRATVANKAEVHTYAQATTFARDDDRRL